MGNRTWTCVPCRKSYRRVQWVNGVVFVSQMLWRF